MDKNSHKDNQQELINRRKFLQFIGASTVIVGSASSLGLLSSCTKKAKKTGIGFTPITPSSKDELVLADGLNSKILIKWGTPINKNEFFGDNNDYTAFLPLEKDRALFWVNHEYTNPLFSSGIERTKENAIKEMKQMGGSILEIKKTGDSWSVVEDSKYNRRIDGTTPIKFANGVKVRGRDVALGTNSNCAGGVTPWGTILTCEENYQNCWGERAEDGSVDLSQTYYGWAKHFDSIPEHYGWVVEVDLKTGKAQKHTSIGRFSHESATVALSKKGLPVIYSGDDKSNEFLYKYIGEEKNKIGKGTLYVADLKNKKWLPLDLEKSPQLKEQFKSQLDVLTYARKAAKILGATELDRPEDIEIDKETGHVYVTLTNNKKKGNYMGQILKVAEKGDHDSLEFEWEYFTTGGDKGGFACPDNLIFDKAGNLWIATDISGSAINKSPYEKFQHNGLFVIPRSGFGAGKAYQVASAPKDAEFTGLSFDSDQKTLFVSVQHPGERTKDKSLPTSTWPDRDKVPKSAVVAITGPTLDKIVGGLS